MFNSRHATTHERIADAVVSQLTPAQRKHWSDRNAFVSCASCRGMICLDACQITALPSGTLYVCPICDAAAAWLLHLPHGVERAAGAGDRFEDYVVASSGGISFFWGDQHASLEATPGFADPRLGSDAGVPDAFPAEWLGASESALSVGA